MASLKREEEFRINHKKYKDLLKHFHISFWMAIIPSGCVFVLMMIYYFIRTLAMLAGGGAFFAQVILNYANGTNEKSPLAFEMPYLLLFYLFLIGVSTFMSFYFRLRKPHKFIFCTYLAGAVFGFVGLLTGNIGVIKGLYLVIYGIYGMWLEDYVLRLHKELDELALKEGFPDFIEAINEPRPMANTSGLHYSQSEFMKRQQMEKKEDPNGETDPVKSFEMDELTMDTPLPKSSRRIDNMMFKKSENGSDILPETNDMEILDTDVPVQRSKRRIDSMM